MMDFDSYVPVDASLTRFCDSGRVASALVGKTDISLLVSTLRSLPTEQREVLLLVTLEGMSYREAADAQGVPIGTVMSRLSRARTTLREYLDGELPPLRDVSSMGKRP